MDVEVTDFSCTVSTNLKERPIALTIKLNDHEVFTSTIVDDQDISIPVTGEGQQQLKFIVSGKTDDCTIRNDDGDIVDSTTLKLSNLSFDGFDLNKMLLKSPLPYTHNFNGNGNEVTEDFFDIAGCNGEIVLNFSTPIYNWLLENM